ncbi:hypothetical protein BDV12DRAFT_204977 [Aspergillus spectabilis]
MPSRVSPDEVQPPLATTIHLSITLLLIASYIPQLLKLNTNGAEDISGWYMILLTTSATAHLATRIRSVFTFDAWECFRHGHLKGFELFSALVVYLQPLAHWIAAISLLAVFVLVRAQASQPAPSNNHQASGNSKEDSVLHQRGIAAASATTTTTSPSNATILTIVLTHAVVTLPLAIHFLDLMTRTEDDDPTIIFFNVVYGTLLRFTGISTSLTAAIPQIKLMVTRSRDANGDNSNHGSGSLSLLTLGLQVIAFIALGASQGWRVSERQLPPPPEDCWSWDWWMRYVVVGGMAGSWGALAIGQLVVLCVILGLGFGSVDEGQIRL